MAFNTAESYRITRQNVLQSSRELVSHLFQITFYIFSQHTVSYIFIQLSHGSFFGLNSLRKFLDEKLKLYISRVCWRRCNVHTKAFQYSKPSGRNFRCENGLC